MTRGSDDAPIERILVALDTSASARAALQAAVSLAAQLRAELLGLFVEDANLLRLASLPFAREAHAGPTAERALDEPAMARGLRAEAEQLRRSLASEAERLRLRWSFQVARGSVSRELLSAAEQVDLIVMGTRGRSPRTGPELGSTARAAVRAAPRSVALLQQGERVGRPVVVVYDGSATADRALELGVALARTDDQQLEVLVQEPDARAAEARRQALEARLLQRGLAAHARTLVTAGSEGLTRAARAAGGRILVLPADHPLCDEQGIAALLARTGCPVVIAR
jgi:nucleotide-binding universal stress UspA family protein